jgi:phenylacetate-CoA ligase
MGSVGYECEAAPGGLHIIESEFIAEVIDPASGKPIPDGNEGELVLTNLGRWGSPLIRYRSGDLVRLSRGRCACGSWFARLEGGILSRVDDMFIVRGNNVFPVAVESVLRQFPEIAEFRVNVCEEDTLTRVLIEIESEPDTTTVDLADRVERAIQTALSFRADIQSVPRGALPRFEMKAHRFIREGKRKKT